MLETPAPLACLPPGCRDASWVSESGGGDKSARLDEILVDAALHASAVSLGADRPELAAAYVVRMAELDCSDHRALSLTVPWEVLGPSAARPDAPSAGPEGPTRFARFSTPLQRRQLAAAIATATDASWRDLELASRTWGKCADWDANEANSRVLALLQRGQAAATHGHREPSRPPGRRGGPRRKLLRRWKQARRAWRAACTALRLHRARAGGSPEDAGDDGPATAATGTCPPVEDGAEGTHGTQEELAAAVELERAGMDRVLARPARGRGAAGGAVGAPLAKQLLLPGRADGRSRRPPPR